MRNNWELIASEIKGFTKKKPQTVEAICTYFGISRRTFYRWHMMLVKNGFNIRRTNWGRPALYEVKG